MPRKKVGEGQTTGVILTLEERRFIKNEMRRRGWQQIDLAVAAELSQMTISSALRGYGMWAKNRVAIYKAFNDHPVPDFLKETA